jgi:hypothetical protein
MFDIVFIASSDVVIQGAELNCVIYPEVHVSLVGLLYCHSPHLYERCIPRSGRMTQNIYFSGTTAFNFR